MIKLDGIDDLLDALEVENKNRLVKSVVKHHGGELHRTMVRNAQFKGHYKGSKFIKPTGATRRSIDLKLTNGSTVAVVAPHTHYAAYLELGTRYMNAQPFVERSLKAVEKQFITDLERIGAKK